MSQEENNQTEPKIRRCKQCRKAGHDVRNCPIFQICHRETLSYYDTWLKSCVVDYQYNDKWNYSDDYENKPPDDLLQIFRENRESECALHRVLLTTTPYLKGKPIEYLRILAHVYNIPKTMPYKRFTKEQWEDVLHKLLYAEAEQQWTRRYTISEVLPYLHSSIVNYDQMEQTWYTVETSEHLQPIPLINTKFHLISIHDRQRKLRELRNYNMRNLRFISQDLERNGREDRELRRRMNDLRERRNRIVAECARLEERLQECETNLILFESLPPDPPRIRFLENTKPVQNVDCFICYNNIFLNEVAQLNCGHKFCANCILMTVCCKYNSREEELGNCSCPMCRQPITTLEGNISHMKLTLQTAASQMSVSNSIAKLVGGI
jgi:hypothetical protein